MTDQTYTMASENSQICLVDKCPLVSCNEQTPRKRKLNLSVWKSAGWCVLVLGKCLILNAAIYAMLFSIVVFWMCIWEWVISEVSLYACDHF